MVSSASTTHARRQDSLSGKRLRRPPPTPNLLPMGKQEWPHAEFVRYLDRLSRAAGIPDSRRGTPNTSIFFEITGVSATQQGRWRSGTHQPTTDSLRMIANGLGPRAGRDSARVLVDLEVRAGRRSEEEARVSRARPRAAREPDLDKTISLLELRLDQDPPDEERRELELKLVRARRARDAQRLADELRAEIESDSA